MLVFRRALLAVVLTALLPLRSTSELQFSSLSAAVQELATTALGVQKMQVNVNCHGGGGGVSVRTISCRNLTHNGACAHIRPLHTRTHTFKTLTAHTCTHSLHAHTHTHTHTYRAIAPRFPTLLEARIRLPLRPL